MFRRSTRGHGRMGGSVPTGVRLDGVTGWSGSDYYAGGSAPAGSGAFTIGVVCKLDDFPASDGIAADKNSISSVEGWAIRTLSSNRVRFDAGDGSSLITSPLSSVSQLGAVHRLVGVIDVTANNIMRFYHNGSEVGSGTAMTSYTADAGVGTSFGIYGGLTSEAGDWLTIVAVVAAQSTALSAAQIATWDASVKGGSYDFPAGTTHRWLAADAGAAWEDGVGSVALTRTGSPEVVKFDAVYA